jgi:hypothetical protein
VDNAAFLAVYVPLVVFAAYACWLYARHVLWTAWRADRLSVREHGIVVGMVFAYAADMTENVYYGIGRVSRPFYETISWSVPHVMSMKSLILIGALFAVGGYYQAVHDRGVMWALVAFAFVLWFWAFIGIKVFL